MLPSAAATTALTPRRATRPPGPHAPLLSSLPRCRCSHGRPFVPRTRTRARNGRGAAQDLALVEGSRRAPRAFSGSSPQRDALPPHISTRRVCLCAFSELPRRLRPRWRLRPRRGLAALRRLLWRSRGARPSSAGGSRLTGMKKRRKTRTRRPGLQQARWRAAVARCTSRDAARSRRRSSRRRRRRRVVRRGARR